MVRYARIALWLAVGSAFLPAVHGQRPAQAEAQGRIPLAGKQARQGANRRLGHSDDVRAGMAYPHKKPVLTGKDVAEARLHKADFSSSGLPSELYMVSFRLTTQARKKLVAACGDEPERMLVVLVDGASWVSGTSARPRPPIFTPRRGSSRPNSRRSGSSRRASERRHRAERFRPRAIGEREGKETFLEVCELNAQCMYP